MGFYWTCPNGHVCSFGDDEDPVCRYCDATPDDVEPPPPPPPDPLPRPGQVITWGSTEFTRSAPKLAHIMRNSFATKCGMNPPGSWRVASEMTVCARCRRAR